MACVGVFIGQCGVTLGLQLLSSSPPAMQSYDGTVHAVFVDTEIKVLRRYRRGLSAHSAVHLHSGVAGCGGCYAKGVETAEQSLPDVMRMIEGQVERTDCCGGFLLVHSLAGGTGSGFGATLTRELRSRYGAMFVCNVAVLPFRSGENPVQSYNTLLALHGLQAHSDMVLLVENSVVAEEVGATSTTMAHLNQKIVEDLQVVMSNCKQIPARSALWEAVKSVAAIPAVKLCSIGGCSGLRNVSEAVEKTVRSVKRRTGFGKCRTLAAVVATYNPSSQLLDERSEEKLRRACNFAKWNPFPIDFWSSSSKLPKLSYILNCSSVCNSIVSECDNAMLKFHAGAYLHWFEQHGVQKDEFLEAFETCNDLVNSYNYFCT